MFVNPVLGLSDSLVRVNLWWDSCTRWSLRLEGVHLFKELAALEGFSSFRQLICVAFVETDLRFN